MSNVQPDDFQLRPLQSIDGGPGPLGLATVLPTAPVARAPLYNPSFGETLALSFEYGNSIAALAASARGVHVQHQPDPGYDPFKDPMLAGLGLEMVNYAHVRSEAERDEVSWRIMRERMNKEKLAESGWTGVGLSLLAAAADPLNYIGAGELRTGAGIAESALRMAKPGLLSGVLTETAMSANEPGRTPGETVGNIGLTTLLMGTMGAAFARGGKAPAEVGELVGRFEKEMDAADPQRSVGAAGTPGAAARTPAQDLAGEGLKPTGLGLERLPDTPVKRMLMSAELRVRELASELADLGGMTQAKNTEAGGFRATAQPVERATREYLYPLVEALRAQDNAYLAYRGRAAVEGDARMAWENARLAISDMVNGRGGFLSHAEFREEVGKALHSGDTHAISEVQQAAREYRKVLDFVKTRAEAEDLFTVDARKELNRMQQEMTVAQAAGDAARVKSLGAKVMNLQKEIDDIRANGPSAQNAKSYAPLVMRRDKIDADRAGLKQVVTQHLAPKYWAKVNAVADPKLRQVVQAQAMRDLDTEAETMIERMRNQRPWRSIDEDATGMARSLHTRDLDIPVEKLFPWMELDAEALLRQYTRTMGADIELTKRFGSMDMRDVIGEIEQGYLAKISGNQGNPADLRAAMQRDLEDIRALRDRLRGTYGAPDDPYSTTASMIRVAKTLNYITMLGGVFLSSLPDIARPIMTEGFNRAFPGLQALMKRLPEAKLAIREAELAGEALDIVLGSRAAAFLDIGDVFGRAMPLERTLNTASGAFSMLNLLNPWTDIMKRWSAAVTGSRILEEAGNWTKGTIAAGEAEKLARAGIDKPMAERIAKMFDQYGTKGEHVLVANTEAWADKEAVAAYRSALVADVDRTIVTPGVGDTPLWTSSQFGSLVSQFKKFALASTQRVLISGLQDRDQAFWTGAAALVGMGLVADYLKTTIQSGTDWTKKPWQERVGNAVDRAGIGGYFMEANNIIERLSDNRVGVRPFLGGQHRRVGFESKVGAVAGPTAQQLATVSGILSDFGSLQYNSGTARQIRRLMPAQSLFWAQPGFDALEHAMSP